MQRLQSKTALITGAAQGIGEAISRAFVREGAFVFVTDIQDEKGRAVAESLKDFAQYIHLDVSKEHEWEAAFKTIFDTRGALNILVNNAGITGYQDNWGPQDPENILLESWRRVHEVNSDGTMLGCKYAIRAMKPHGGSIINISSRSGLVGIPMAAAYAASKAAIRNHTKSVALYCAEKGYKIRCNSIHPAAILTPMWEPMLGTGDARTAALKALSKDIPLGKFGEPDDVAQAAIFLASDESKYITGIELNVDGGVLAGSAAAPGNKEE
jgi:NAD(P)-dependent dehydrogenase (short-subunit alcohol dehydrogenase family)